MGISSDRVKEPVCDGPTERTVRSLLRIGVDPLVVIGGVREQVHLFLGDLAPLGVAQILPCELGHLVEQNNGLGGHDMFPLGFCSGGDGRHRMFLSWDRI